jgi:nucleoside-diphosphate-sugar epimerase
MKILVTGGAGYIGSTLIPKLLVKGHEVTAIDNFMYKQTPLLECCHDDNFNLIRGDVRDSQLIDEEMKKADVIIPLACLVGAPLCNSRPDESKHINYKVIAEMYDKKSNDQMMIYPCTNSGYGIGQDGIFCDENSPLKPISQYGIDKVAAETHLLDGGEAITFRFATVFGPAPRMRLDLLVNDFVYRAFYDRSIVLFESHFKRNYLNIHDATEVFIHAMDNYSSMKGLPYNVGLSDANLNKRELCEKIKEYIPSFQIIESEIGQDPDKRNYIVSNERIEATGFKPRISIDDGIKALIKSYEVIKRNEYANF